MCSQRRCHLCILCRFQRPWPYPAELVDPLVVRELPRRGTIEDAAANEKVSDGPRFHHERRGVNARRHLPEEVEGQEEQCQTTGLRNNDACSSAGCAWRAFTLGHSATSEWQNSRAIQCGMQCARAARSDVHLRSEMLRRLASETHRAPGERVAIDILLAG